MSEKSYGLGMNLLEEALQESRTLLECATEATVVSSLQFNTNPTFYGNIRDLVGQIPALISMESLLASLYVSAMFAEDRPMRTYRATIEVVKQLEKLERSIHEDIAEIFSLLSAANTQFYEATISVNEDGIVIINDL